MGRYYKKDGKRLPSVTTITGQLDKPALVYWAANCACDCILEEADDIAYWTWQDDPGHCKEQFCRIIEYARKNFRKVSAKALDTGSAVHAAIELYLKTGQEPQAPSDEVLSAFIAFLEWKDEVQMETLKTEHSLYADRYAGTCDLICNLTLNGKTAKYIVDFKAAKGIYPEYAYQIAAYRACDPTLEGCGILRLDKETGLPEWKDTSDTYPQDMIVFNCLVDLWYAKRPNFK